MNSLIALIALLPLALAAPTTPAIEIITEHAPLSEFNMTEIAALEKRDSCGSNVPYNIADMNTLISNLQSDGQTDYTPHASGVSHSYNTARICIYNQYWVENTHVSHWEGGWAASYIAGKCCTSGNVQCAGGSCTAHGDSGLAVKVVTKNSAYSCW